MNQTFESDSSSRSRHRAISITMPTVAKSDPSWRRKRLSSSRFTNFFRLLFKLGYFFSAAFQSYSLLFVWLGRVLSSVFFWLTMATVESVQELVRKRDKMEGDILALLEVLDSQGVGMDAPLVDKEDFPRADIDIVQVRTLRHQVICLRNDAKALTKEIEQGLADVHSQARKDRGESATSPPTSPTAPEKPRVAFLRVGEVSDGSPAQDAGFKDGDLITKLGSITADNFTGLQDVAKLTQHAENRPVGVELQRDGQRKNVILKPRRWSGRGLLGCHVVVVKS